MYFAVGILVLLKKCQDDFQHMNQVKSWVGYFLFTLYTLNIPRSQRGRSSYLEYFWQLKV